MATTINAYSVGLSLNADNYIRNSNLSRRETSQLARDIGRARTPAENYQRTIDRLDRALNAGAISQKTYNRLLSDAKSKHRSASDATRGHTAAIQNLKTSLGATAAAYVSIGAVARTSRWAFQLASDAEQAQIAFEVLTKDVGVANKLLSELRTFSASTPFRQDEIINSGRTLLAFGFSAGEVTDRLTTMGNISAATGSRIEELAEILGKMRVQNTIMSEDINQLTGRGINVIDGLAERLGIMPDQVKDAASKSKIHFDDLLAVLSDLSENDFGGMIARQSETAAGKMSTLQDKVDELGRAFGRLGVESGALDWITRQADQAAKGVGFLAGLFAGEDPRMKQAEAEAELFQSEQLLRDLRAGRDSAAVQEMRRAGQQQITDRIVAEKTARENAFRAENADRLQRERQANRERANELWKRMGFKTQEVKDKEQLEELKRMRAEWARLQESQTFQIVAAISDNAFKRIR